MGQSTAPAYRTAARDWSPIKRRLFEYSTVHREALADPLVERFLCQPENAAAFLRALVTRAESAVAILDDRFATHLYEAQFVSYVRKRLRLTARRLALRRATLTRREFPLSAWPGDDDQACRQAPPLESLGLPARASEADSQLSTDLAHAIQEGALIRALDELPARQRLVLEALLIHDKTERQLARELGVSQQAVSKMKRRAIEKLRAALDPARRGEGTWKNC